MQFNYCLQFPIVQDFEDDVEDIRDRAFYFPFPSFKEKLEFLALLNSGFSREITFSRLQAVALAKLAVNEADIQFNLFSQGGDRYGFGFMDTGGAVAFSGRKTRDKLIDTRTATHHARNKPF